ncbi:MAG TPA: PIN domain-containing protein, partial [Verrucomicrobiae bacterium]
MIHLDTNYLVRLLILGSAEAVAVDHWLASGQTLAASAIAWSEFLNGPVAPMEISRVEAVLESRIISFGKSEAAFASDLFNKTGRRRGSRFDCLIASNAILQQAEFA